MTEFRRACWPPRLALHPAGGRKVTEPGAGEGHLAAGPCFPAATTKGSEEWNLGPEVWFQLPGIHSMELQPCPWLL